jgi:hypothetical protein
LVSLPAREPVRKLTEVEVVECGEKKQCREYGQPASHKIVYGIAHVAVAGFTTGAEREGIGSELYLGVERATEVF